MIFKTTCALSSPIRLEALLVELGRISLHWWIWTLRVGRSIEGCSACGMFGSCCCRAVSCCRCPGDRFPRGAGKGHKAWSADWRRFCELERCSGVSEDSSCDESTICNGPQWLLIREIITSTVWKVHFSLSPEVAISLASVIEIIITVYFTHTVHPFFSKSILTRYSL